MNLYKVINQEHNAQQMMAKMVEDLVSQADKDGFDVEFYQDEYILTERKQESK